MDVGLREAVRWRARGCCEYCRLPDEADPLGVFHLEHIIAKQHGGGDESGNRAWSCSRCNRKKGTNIASLDPESGLQARLFNPRNDRWNEHFALQDASIIGLTPIGRATVRLLDFNSVRRVGLRRRLIRRGKFSVT